MKDRLLLASAALATAFASACSEAPLASTTGIAGDAGPDDARDAQPSMQPVDAGAPFFYLIDPTPAHVQAAASDSSRLRTSTLVRAVSSDGTTVLAESHVLDVVDEAVSLGGDVVRWTVAGGTAALDLPPPCVRNDGQLPQSDASGMSSDGSIVFGSCGPIGGSLLFRWDQASGVVEVPSPPGLEGRWVTVSSDGATALGEGRASKGDTMHASQAFRWTLATGAVGLGTLPGAAFSDAQGGMTPDGKLILGASGNDAYRWTEATGMVALPRPEGYETCAPAFRQVSQDGTTVAGQCRGSAGYRIFRWTGTDAPRAIPLPVGASVENLWMTADGGVVFGTMRSSGKTRGFRWTEAKGVVEIGPAGNCVVGAPWTYGRTANADGSVLFGSCSGTFVNDADRSGFRWTQAEGLVPLVPLAGHDGVLPDSISEDGWTIVGQSLVGTEGIPNTVAVTWGASGKASSIGERLTSLGFDLKGFDLVYATILPDAPFITGIAKNAAGERRAWIARLP